MLAHINDALCRLPVLPLLPFILCTPCAFFAFIIELPTATLSSLGANDICVGVDGGEFRSVQLGEGEEFSTDRLEIGGVVKEELKKDWWCGKKVVRLFLLGGGRVETKL